MIVMHSFVLVTVDVFATIASFLEQEIAEETEISCLRLCYYHSPLPLFPPVPSFWLRPSAALGLIRVSSVFNPWPNNAS